MRQEEQAAVIKIAKAHSAYIKAKIIKKNFIYKKHKERKEKLASIIPRAYAKSKKNNNNNEQQKCSVWWMSRRAFN